MSVVHGRLGQMLNLCATQPSSPGEEIGGESSSPLIWVMAPPCKLSRPPYVKPSRQPCVLRLLPCALPRSPSQPSSDANWEMHLGAYEALFDEQELTCCGCGGHSSSGSSVGSGSSAAPADGAPLSGLIRVFAQAANSGSYVQLAWRAAGWMGEAGNWPGVRRQLAQLAAAAPSLGGQLPGLLAGAALPSLQQLRYITWLMVYEMANGLLGATVTQEHGVMPLSTHTLELTPAQRQLAELAEHQAAAMLVQLEPGSPRSHMFAGDFAASQADTAASAQHLKRCIKLAHALPSRCACSCAAAGCDLGWLLGWGWGAMADRLPGQNLTSRTLAPGARCLLRGRFVPVGLLAAPQRCCAVALCLFACLPRPSAAAAS